MPVRKPLAVLALAALCAPSLAHAVGWYAGVSIGQSRTSADLVRNRESTIVNATDLQTEFDDTDNAWKIGAGYRFNDVLAIEVNYADLGKHSTVTTMLAGDAPAFAAIAIDRRITGFGADLVASAPLAPRFSIYGRAGAFRSKLKAEAALAGNIIFTNGDPTERNRSTTRYETVLRYGIGAAWEMWRNGALHVEWERYNKVGKAFAIGGSGTTGEADTDAFWIGATQRF